MVMSQAHALCDDRLNADSIKPRLMTSPKAILPSHCPREHVWAPCSWYTARGDGAPRTRRQERSKVRATAAQPWLSIRLKAPACQVSLRVPALSLRLSRSYPILFSWVTWTIELL